ncbi:MAG: glucokinase [Rhodocyclaceae bacterium]|nr:glucokinase [Rhodocyclaceae bacterium]
MKLVGDIGGTKVLLALVDEGKIVQRCRLASADFSSFDALLGAYLRDLSVSIDGGCLAVAGPVADDGRLAKITNLPWAIDAAALERKFAISPGRLTLINDFAGVALGVTALLPDQRSRNTPGRPKCFLAPWGEGRAERGLRGGLITLQAGEPRADGVKLVIGAGTGLGMALLVPEGDGFRVLPGEGGHIGFAPQDETQARIWAALLKEHGRVTAERVVSGPGLAAIHRILTGENADPADISERALGGGAAARRSIEVFLAAFGAFAGDMALAAMARGGVTLAGGIAAKILPLLQTGAFLTAFNAKAEHADLARRMPVQVATDPEIGLRGAALRARE